MWPKDKGIDLLARICAESFVIQLLHQMSCYDVLSVKPYSVPNLIQWCLMEMDVIELGHLISNFSKG